jgi:Protein of unknown function (DUF1360)
VISGILAIFGVFRVARMVAYEEGPFEVFTRLRNRFVVDNWIGRGLRCPLCIGFWLALIAALWLQASPLVAWWLGIAGAQAALHLALGDGNAR